MTLQKVCNENELDDGEGRPFRVGEKMIAVFKKDGKFFAVDNTCPHMGGPLGEGFLEDYTVTCPWHGWQFDVKTGVSPVNPAAKVKTYPVTVKNSEVFVDL